MIGSAAKRLISLSTQLKFNFTVEKQFRYKFMHGAHMIPHPEKAYKGGEDAMFASENVLVVADGVGGWADQGVDPGLYSKKLCEIIGRKVTTSLNDYVDNPQKLLVEAVKENKETGSTTICILTLNPSTGRMLVYYLGDSVYGFFKNDLVQVAEDQQKSFNFPYQVGSIGDDPILGVLHEHKPENTIEKTIVVASDGLWDNYELGEIQRDIAECKDGDYNAMAKRIAENAFKYSLKDNYQSPFFKKALVHKLRTYQSGKPDDITVLVARIKKQALN